MLEEVSRFSALRWVNYWQPKDVKPKSNSISKVSFALTCKF